MGTGFLTRKGVDLQIQNMSVPVSSGFSNPLLSLN